MDNAHGQSPEQQINTLRIIVGAMAMGLLVFGVVVNAAFGPAGGPDAANGPMTKIGLVVGLVALLSHRTVSSFVLAQGIRGLPPDEDAARSQLMAARIPSTIVACAIVEGAAFLNLIVYGFLDGQPVSMAMAAILWLAIMTKFPLPGTLENWMDRELRTARDERELQSGG